MPDDETIAMLRRLISWSEAGAVHARHFERARNKFYDANVAINLRREWKGDGQNASVREPPRRRATMGQMWSLAAHVHGVVISASHVWTCVRAVGREKFADPPKGAEPHSIRNFEEHWERLFPPVREAIHADFEPGTFVLADETTWVAGVAVEYLVAWMEVTNYDAREQLEAATGRPAPHRGSRAPRPPRSETLKPRRRTVWPHVTDPDDPPGVIDMVFPEDISRRTRTSARQG